MARRRRKKNEEEAQQQLRPKSSPALFLGLWLAVPMVLMIAYAFYLTQN